MWVMWVIFHKVCYKVSENTFSTLWNEKLDIFLTIFVVFHPIKYIDTFKKIH